MDAVFKALADGSRRELLDRLHVRNGQTLNELCEQMEMQPVAMLDYLKGRGCRVGGVTMGERGLLWYDETGAIHALPAFSIASERVIDTNGAGDVFHGA
jgi:sugar/nucleoside kinase (ribokinase family)